LEQERLKYARSATQNFLKFLKREKMEELTAQGQLRSNQTYQFSAELLPAIEKQVQIELSFK